MDELRVGIIGSGWVAANRYLPVLGRLEDVRIIGIADHNVERAGMLAHEYASAAHSNAPDLLDSDPAVVFICTSPFSHASLTVTALERGIHVFVEKPMAIEVDDANRMVTTAARTGMKLGVSHNFLFSRSVRAALTRIDSGDLGQVRHVQAFQASSPNRRLPVWYPDLPGGLFFDEAPHMMYLLDALVGNLNVSHAWSRQGGEPKSLAALGVDFIGASGVMAELTMVFDAPISEWFLSIICDGGVVVVDLFRDIHFVIPPDGGHRPHQILRTSLAGMMGHGIGTFKSGLRYVAGKQFWGHDVIIEDFLSAVREDRAPLVTGKDGARVVSVMTRVLEAAGF